MIYSLLVFALSFSNLSSISDQNSVDISVYSIGTWEWEETQLLSRGGGNKTTPETCNCTKRLELDEDGNMRQYENEVLVSEGPFEIEKIEFIDDPIRYQFQSTSLFGTIRKMENDRLGIGAFGSCGQIHFYKRVDLNE